MTTTEKFVIVGAGLAGAKAAEALREEGFDGQITLIGAEQHLPYDRPPLSKKYLQGAASRDKLLVHHPDWYADHQVRLRTSTTVTAIDRPARQVVTDTGERLRYDKLLLATGSTPRRLALPGAQLDGVHYLRSVDDSDRIKARLIPGARVVVIGGGWIGLETAAAAQLAGCQVTVVERASLLLMHLLGRQVAQVFADLHRRHGVDIRCDATVAGIRPATNRTTVAAVDFEDGSSLPADLVIVGIGVTPKVDLARASGLEVDNGITVDEHLRSSDPDIHAAGDVANAYHPALERRIRVDHWATALHQPAIAAASMLGQHASHERLPYFFTDQYELGMEYTGYVQPGDYDQVVIRGRLDAEKFIAFWLRDHRALAGMGVNTWDAQESISSLIRARVPVDTHQLADPIVPLHDLTG